MSKMSMHRAILLGLLATTPWTGTAQAQTSAAQLTCATDQYAIGRSFVYPNVGTDSNPFLHVVRNNEGTDAFDVGTGAVKYSSVGAYGGTGSSADLYDSAGRGGRGGDGDHVALINCSQIGTFGYNSSGIFVSSTGGTGGTGGSGDLVRYGAAGGNGGNGGNLDIFTTANSNIGSYAELSHGIYAFSKGGNGGNGGAHSFVGGGNGATGGNGGTINIVNNGRIYTEGRAANGIQARSEGGEAGSGSTSTAGSSGKGGAGGNAGSEITGQNNGAITIRGDDANAMLLESIGGQGGDSSKNFGLFVAIGGAGGIGGDGGGVSAINNGTLITTGNNTKGIQAQSIGGGGGHGGDAYNVGVFGGVSIGGSGGGGGSGNYVRVDNSGNITTSGSGSHAILANSIGGGGGDGGNAKGITLGYAVSFQSSIGGSGGSGGFGGNVAVNQRGSSHNRTSGDNSAGLIANSIGGGGGNGGNALSVAASASGNTPTLSVAVGIGGTAGEGGNANNVTVNTDSGTDIKTSGRLSDGLVAQSIGGGGGSGGNVITIAASIAEANGSIGVGVGGKGGKGGNAGAVTVVNNGTISTLSEISNALVARSVGGGGGSGGNVIDVAAGVGKYSASLNVGIGGKGDIGGSASTASITNTGDIFTNAHLSNGITAQSIGGGGGSGGNVHTYAVAVSLGGGSSGKTMAVDVGIGGNGGAGGNAGQASVVQSGNVTTQGDLSSGVLVQSLGGGGGSGGNVIAISVAASLDQVSTNGGAKGARNLSAAIAVGGKAGVGGIGGNAIYSGTDGASVTTNGARSSAITVQSIGGGGGVGGNAHSFALATAFPVDLSRFRTAAAGLLGKIGLGEYYNPNDAPSSDSKTGLDATVSVGGEGGHGNIGGNTTVTLSQSMTILTNDSQSYGVFAQSVGGGGGSAGYAFSDGYAGAGALGLTMAIGGNGSTGGHGGTVNVLSNAFGNEGGSIQTKGDQSHGILAQSVGGGGGEAGHATSQFFSIPYVGTAIGQLNGFSAAFALGGKAGAGGDGGATNVNYFNNISTTGKMASGIIAQSVGGGGGIGGGAISSGVVKVDLGGQGASGGNGGNVSVSGINNILTTGSLAHGIIAQSAGGGGGIGGNTAAVDRVSPGFGLQFNFGGSGGGGGNGGNVTVSRSSSITTTGATAFGILAQSVGGGGGIASASSITVGPVQVPVHIGHNGSLGNGGNILVTSGEGNLDITTSGVSAHGVFAQSIGGGGGIGIFEDKPGYTFETGVSNAANSTGGNVTTAINGHILTTGNNAYGIFAHSQNSAISLVGGDGTQVISNLKNLGTGLIYINQAGTVTTRGDNAHAIVTANANQMAPIIDYRLPNLTPATGIAINGTVNVSGNGSWGIMATNGHASVFASPNQNSEGTRVDIHAGASINVLGNALQSGGGMQSNDYLGLTRVHVSGALNALGGTAVQSVGPTEVFAIYGGQILGDIIGTGGNYLSVTNNGLMNGSVIGGTNYESNNGRHMLAIDPVGRFGGSDRIQTNELLNFGGTFVPYLVSLPYHNVSDFWGPIGQDFEPIQLITASSGNGVNVATMNPSLSTRYTYAVNGLNVTITGISVDFTRAGLTDHDGDLARIATDMLEGWAEMLVDKDFDDLNSILTSAANATSKDDLAKILEDFDSTGHFSTAEFVASSQQYDLGNMQSCGSASGTFAAIKESNCNWAKVIYAESDLRNGDQKHEATTLAFGRQKEASPGLFLGYSAGYESHSYTGQNTTGKGHRLFVGAIAKRLRGPLLLSGSASATYGWSDGKRLVGATGDIALSEHKTSSLATRLRGVYLVEVGPINVMPMVELDMSVIKDAGYRETGAGAFNLRRHSKTHFLADLRPALRLGTDVHLGTSIIRGYVEGGARRSLNEMTHDFHMKGARENASVSINSGRDKVVGTLATGLSILSGDRYELGARYEASMGKETMSHTASFKMGLKF